MSGNKDEFIYEKLKAVKEILDDEQKVKRMKIFQGIEGYHKQSKDIVDWREIKVEGDDGPTLEEKETPTSEW